LGGEGRKVLGRLSTTAAGKTSDFDGYLVKLKPNLLGLSFPDREQFASADEFVTAIESWRGRRFEFQNTPAGIESLGHTRGYGALVGADGSFEIDDVLPGSYVVIVEAAPNVRGSPGSIKFDPAVMRWLDSFSRAIVIPKATDADVPPFDLGVWRPTLEKP
jgi:hypothetical protein